MKTPIIIIATIIPILIVTAEIVKIRDGVRLEVSPNYGGNLSFYGYEDGENLLYSTISESSKVTSQVNYNTPHISLNGHTIWLSPQKGWWKHQDLIPEKKGAIWPPPQVLDMGKYEILEESEYSIKIKSPKCPISGVSLIKELNLHEKGRLTLKTIMTNERDEEVEWGIWSNTRVPIDANVYVPFNKDTSVRVETSTSGLDPSVVQGISYQSYKNLFYFDISKLREAQGETKAFFNYLPSYFAVFSGNSILIKKADSIPVEKIADSQAQVEFFVSYDTQTKKGFYELEFHGEHAILQSGESVHFSETWELYKYNGKEIVEEHSIYLNEVGLLSNF